MMRGRICSIRRTWRMFPALAVMLAVLSFNFIGDALRDLLDPRMRSGVEG